MMLKQIFQNVLAGLLVFTSATVFAVTPDVDTTNVAAPANTSNVYTEDKPNIMVDAKHPEFVIKLKSNPTTGYSWFLREYASSLVAPIKHSFQAPTQKLMGAPGYELWTFKIKPSGFVVPQQTTIRFVYARPWQDADSATQIVFRVTTH